MKIQPSNEKSLDDLRAELDSALWDYSVGLNALGSSVSAGDFKRAYQRHDELFSEVASVERVRRNHVARILPALARMCQRIEHDTEQLMLNDELDMLAQIKGLGDLQSLRPEDIPSGEDGERFKQLIYDAAIALGASVEEAERIIGETPNHP